MCKLVKKIFCMFFFFSIIFCNNVFAESAEKLLKPKFDGMTVEDTYIKVNLKTGIVNSDEGNEFVLKNLYVSENGSTMVSLREAAKIVNVEYIEWDDLTKIASINLNYESGQQKDIYVDFKNQKICSYINGQYSENKIKIQNIDGSIYIPLRDFLNSFGIDNSRIFWNNDTADVFIYNFYNFNSDKVTIGTRYENQLGDKRFYYITDKNIINNIGKICEKGFYSVDIEKGRIQGGANAFIDFNNGTIIELYLDEDLNVGYFSGRYCYLPDGLVIYIKEVIKSM